MRERSHRYRLGMISLSLVVCLLGLRLSAAEILSVVEFQFREEQDAGSQVGNVALATGLWTFLTRSEFDSLKFEIPTPDYFKIDRQGQSLTSAVRIDREAVCDSVAVCKLTAQIIVYSASTANNVDIFKVIQAVVEILDINDNEPKFPKDSVNLIIPESNNPNEVLQTQGAIDNDMEQYSVKNYSFLNPTDTFKLNVGTSPDGSTFLEIVVRERLDRETKDFYQVTVVATDGGFPPKSGSVTINITVVDINDNAPEFLQQSYNASVQENVPLRVPILKLEAKDRDTGKNAEISYQFSSRVSQKIRQKFGIDEQTGEISAISNIDYEEDKLFQFIVEAVDHGSPQNSSRTNVVIHVEDLNDNYPKININLPPLGTEISENEPIGKFIAQVIALDADSGNNGLVTCKMDDEYFSLDKFSDNAPNTFKIVLAKSLDYEQASSHKVTISCTDGGHPPLSNSTTFVVSVLDVNDNRPAFTESTYYGRVMENLDGGEKVVDVLAHDWDGGDFGKITYSLEDKYNGLFSVDPVSGTIRVTQFLDREYMSRYEFHVLARDNGPERLSSSALVVINVDDENDEPPRFLYPVYFGDVLENQPAGTSVGNASAVDLDTPANSKMAYSILQLGSDYSNFSIDPASGVIKSLTIFDREEKDSYHFVVKVVDPTNTQFFSTCNFTVRVLDDNDHSPVIRLAVVDNSTFIVQHSASVGSIITQISAYDRDELSELVYSIQDGDPYHLFSLNRFKGTLSLARIITARDIKSYTLVIRVQDSGDPPRFDVKSLNIKINGTIPVTSDSGLSQNMLIVIVLIGVTLVLALAILSTILIIRKIDRQRRKNRASEKNSEEKMYQLNQQDHFMHVPMSSPGDPQANNLSKKGRKEVSFSLDEDTDSHNTSNGSRQPLTSFKSGVDKMEHFLDSKAHGTRNTKPSNGLMNIPMRGGDQHGGFRRSGRDATDKCRTVDTMSKLPEDAVSQSSDENDPSDSGRGGSEDDSSHRGSGIDPDHSSSGSKTYSQLRPTSDMKNRMYCQQQTSLYHPKSGRVTSIPSTLIHPASTQHSPHSSITSDFDSDFSGSRASHSRSDSDRSSIQTFGNFGRGTNQMIPIRPRDNNHPPRNVMQDWGARLGAPYNNTDSNGALMRSFHEQSRIRFPPSGPAMSLSAERLARPIPETQGPADRSFAVSGRLYPSTLRTTSQSSLAEEDDRTTTSGSYTINSEDLRREVSTVRDSVV